MERVPDIEEEQEVLCQTATGFDQSYGYLLLMRGARLIMEVRVRRGIVEEQGQA
jgi:hypothetical protein